MVDIRAAAVGGQHEPFLPELKLRPSHQPLEKTALLVFAGPATARTTSTWRIGN